MDIDRVIRLQVMRGNSSDIRKLLLTDNQIELIKRVGKCKYITASELSESLEVSIQNASSKLNTLFNRGYLERLTTTAKSGDKRRGFIAGIKKAIEISPIESAVNDKLGGKT